MAFEWWATRPPAGHPRDCNCGRARRGDARRQNGRRMVEGIFRARVS